MILDHLKPNTNWHPMVAKSYKKLGKVCDAIKTIP